MPNLFRILIIFMFCLICATPVFGAVINIDSSFSDWSGQAHLPQDDPNGDTYRSYDIRNIYWGTNQGVSNIYFMIQRYPPRYNSDSVTYILKIDVNDNGNYSDPVDCYANIEYIPWKKKSFVYVDLYNNRNGYVFGDRGDWGEGENEGSSRVEFYLPMNRVGIAPHQPIRFYVTNDYYIADRAPDSGDIQWSPVPALGKIGLTVILAGSTILLARSIWLRTKC